MNLNLFGPINTLGYGYTSLNFLKSLLQLNVNVSHFVIGQAQLTNSEDNTVLQQGLKNAGSFDLNAPCVKIWHQFDLATRVGTGYYFGFPIFEVDSFKPNEINHLKSCDELIVCSEWAKDVVFCNLTPDKTCSVVPLGVDNSIFTPQQHPQAANNTKCIFFNCGKWEIRKGHDILKDLFLDAFPNEEDVELWMMPTNVFLNKEEVQEWESFYNHPRIKLLGRVNSHQELASIMNATTCGIFPSRAEGWNLEVLEMMACGKLVIVTDYSGHTEFCNKNNSMLTKILELEDAFDGKWFLEGSGQWAKINSEQIQSMANYMRAIYDKWRKSPLIYNEEGVKTARQYSWDNSAKKLLEIIQ